ncbi:myosin light chain kinase domain containing protein protein [Babesia ovis]|uniref:Myosin light chain kinase domain containing protein protein n=1 Tax=Babesia ovis TaxID=5869 RepID=A0A9W5WTZ6_BABOV|nr:myosin light chain kinase domain containing protein protein [Babesia ovis]
MAEQKTEECKQQGKEKEKKEEKKDESNTLLSYYVTNYTAAIVAMCLYMPDQITSISSKHLTVSLMVPAKNTGIYMTKMYATKTLANFSGSLLMLIINMFLPANKWISSVSLVIMALVRVFLVIVYYIPNAAVWFYFTFIIHAFFRGLFENNFYPMAAEHMSVISLSYKGSKVAMWTMQVLFDLIITNKATLMISFHLFITLATTIVAVIGWLYCMFFNTPPEECKTGELESVITSNCTMSKCHSNENVISYVDNEDSMWSVVKRVYSPFMMCMCGWPQKNFYSPGIIPYALVDRSLCHVINIVLMFFSFWVTFVIHMLKKYKKSLSQPWGKPPGGWHMGWLLVIPALGCMPIVYLAMHYPLGAVYKVFRNNRVNTTILYIVLVFSTTVLDNLGYIGVSACSKDSNGNRGKNAMRIISMTSFCAQLVTSFTYRLSTGYLIVWKRYVDDIANIAPTGGMNFFSRFGFWASNSLQAAGRDFVNEFHGNIMDIVKDDPSSAIK